VVPITTDHLVREWNAEIESCEHRSLPQDVTLSYKLEVNIKIQSSGIWCRVVWLTGITNVSEEPAASIFRVEEVNPEDKGRRLLRSSETLVRVCHTTRPYIPEDRNFNVSYQFADIFLRGTSLPYCILSGFPSVCFLKGFIVKIPYVFCVRHFCGMYEAHPSLI
jgi:hypothetical protein